jgi:aryl-alcohol dehydrogenase-like predicted oxidoreductase
MEYVRLGKSGLEVSRLVLGCMTFGVAELGDHGWTIGIEESRQFFKQAIEVGITTFDTANAYSGGTSEEFTGQLLKEFASRDQVVIMTKVYGRMFDGPKGGGLSRAALLTSIDDSLRRLNTDYVDVYQIHRWDTATPIEETMETLNDIVRSGKARYIGASSMYAWQFAKAQYTADIYGWTRFVSMQNQYNLLAREDEREMYPFCTDQGVGVLPWSPLARGRLAREWGAKSVRAATDRPAFNMYHQQEQSDQRTIDAVGEVARRQGISRAQVALAWVLHQSVVTAPIVGSTKPSHISDAVDALDVRLSPEDILQLEKNYVPRNLEGF